MNLRKTLTLTGRAASTAPLRGMLLILSFLIIATILTSAHARHPADPATAQAPAPEPRTTVSAAATASALVAPQGNSVQQRVETELVTITPTGFEPSEITRPQGSFFLEVDNRSGLSEFNIRLDSEHGNRVHQVKVRRERLDWHQEVNLPPGRYVLTEANHPDWRFQLTITAP